MNIQHVLDKRQSHPLDKKERQSIASKKWYSQRREEVIPEKQLFDEAFWAMSITQRSHMMRFHVY